ncbi:hypothetical protein R1sor_019967 [Riccia sorocarpa]|uniref:RING-type E3 ubiquitin transferase n=1 Tax=Riccia sorocarpa TaxID=122646 RepID=A0ABD3IHU3_9MARC
MKSPDFPPIVLSPCGHSFCAKCLSMHVGNQRKKLCPYCRQNIASSAVNLSLQRLIDSFVSLQDRRQPTPPQPPQDEQDKAHFLNKLSAAETRSEILQKELAAAVERRKLLESELCNIDEFYRRLKHRQAETRERLRKVTADNESVDKEVKLLENERAEIQKHMAEENVRSALVDSSLTELKTVHFSTFTSQFD